MMPRDIFVFPRQNTLWYMAESPVHLRMVSINYLGKSYDSDEPKRAWRVKLDTLDEDTMLILQRFQSGCEMLVTHRAQGRKDVFSRDDVIGRLIDCRPVRAWVDYLIDRECDAPLAFNMEIACEFELFMTKEYDHAPR